MEETPDRRPPVGWTSLVATHPDNGRAALEHFANDEVFVLCNDECAHARRVGANVMIGS
jgi:hypothetical protein